MIAIISSNPRARAAFIALCEGRDWLHCECDSLHAVKKLLRASRPSVALLRHTLSDGYSDDVISALTSGPSAARTVKIIVLAGADMPQAQEARQVALGADCVLRDPVRTEVLVEYLAGYLRRDRRPLKPAAQRERSFRFAGAKIFPIDRRVEYGGHRAKLTPRETELVEVLSAAPGNVVTYETLYAEVLGRRFQGDTSNMRVLLGKLDSSLAQLGIVLRNYIQVVPKTGYRYAVPKLKSLRLAKPRAPDTNAAA